MKVKRLSLMLLALAVSATPAFAMAAVPVLACPVVDDEPTPIEDRGEVTDGQQVNMGGTIVTFNVSAVSSMNTVDVSASSANGSSGTKTSDPGKSSTGKNPTTSGTPGLTCGAGGLTVRVNPDNGKPEYKNGKGEWVGGKKVKKKKKVGKEKLGGAPMTTVPATPSAPAASIYAPAPTEDGIGTGPKTSEDSIGTGPMLRVSA